MNFENDIEFGYTDDSLLEVTHENFMGDLKKLNTKAIAITDHGNILAAFEFSQDAKNEGINAIIGMDAYIAPMNRQDFSKPIQRKDISFRLPLLAYSMLGYQTLIKLSSAAYFSRPYLSGFLSQPRIDKELLEANHEGLIGLSGYLEGEICYYILENNYEKALATTKYYANLFGQNNFYIEIQSDATEIHKIANTGLKKIALELDLPIVESKDIYHLAKINHHNYGRVISFSDKNESFINRFHLETDQQAISIPTFKTPDGLTEKEYLEMLAFEGLKTILGVESEKKNYGERLKKELDFLHAKGVNNLRVLAGVEGTGKINGVTRAFPSLQPKQGEFNTDMLKGLDFLLVEMGKRNMKAVIFLDGLPFADNGDGRTPEA